jgi:AI-2 transport protein TqsA
VSELADGWRSSAVVVGIATMAVVALGSALKALAAILVPFVLAVFLLLLVDAIARAQRRALPGWPDWTGTAAGLVVVAAAFVGALWIVGAQAGAAFAQVGAAGERIEALIAAVGRRLGTSLPSFDRLFDDNALSALAGSVFDALQGFASGALLVAIYLAFLVASRAASAAKFERLFHTERARQEASRVVDTVRHGAEQYVWVQTVTGLLIAAASWLVMTLVGQSNALLLALLIFLTSYVPVVGPFLGVFVPPVFALAQFGGWQQPLILIVSLQAINFAVNNVMVPRMQADRLNLDPTVVLLSLGIWSYLWGLPGALLSTPLTVLILAIAAEVRGARWLAVLLSKDGRPQLEVRAG